MTEPRRLLGTFDDQGRIVTVTDGVVDPDSYYFAVEVRPEHDAGILALGLVKQAAQRSSGIPERFRRRGVDALHSAVEQWFEREGLLA